MPLWLCIHAILHSKLRWGFLPPPLFFPRKALNGSVFRTGCTLPEDFLTANNDLNRAPDTYQDSSISNAL